VKLWHWQLLGLTALLMPLAVTGTAAAISHGHAALVVAPAILYIVLVARLVRRASSAAINPRGRTAKTRSADTKAPRPWRHRENDTSVPDDAADQASPRPGQGSADTGTENRTRLPLARR
jgi:hypothetical protein